MKTIYIVNFPIHFTHRIMAFTSLEKAKQICDSLQDEYPATASHGHIFTIETIMVYEDEDINAMK